ncbi:MAG TPA: Rpp14/Pop5 family protein [Candidatus Nanoarchaeia archaeon]|nr:Rpp14/Pop5 family protein [Candidatus Nanoarchaeia archaeon]
MKLLPSLRQKKRYLVFEIRAMKKFSLSEVQEAVESSLLQFLGEWGVAKAGPLFIKEKWNAQKQRFVVKVNHTFVDELKSAVILNKKIKNTPVLIKSVISSGTLKKISSYLQ